ncbi:uncharacterized protein LY79DRAFT_569022 [Colletotrichum navitas]|uniref:Uncharacterized protein n=1 Tax=Colletotrichum navitas TaxID=681940 RepID=A0AAD8UZK3_9PEZI|nr:uncharacterized protein LY79DRAFT_569022 [Colletotrichum navitas]KAK1573268.1 hypothetical protein LY79DRAFT_569022 [Colletotrichum navitas]
MERAGKPRWSGSRVAPSPFPSNPLPYLIPFPTPLWESPTSVDAASLRQELRQGHRHPRTTTQPDRPHLFSKCSETVPTPSPPPQDIHRKKKGQEAKGLSTLA